MPIGDDLLFPWSPADNGRTTAHHARRLLPGDDEPWETYKNVPRPQWKPSTVICLDVDERHLELKEEAKFQLLLEQISKLADWHSTDWTRDVNMPNKVVLIIAWKNEVVPSEAKFLTSPIINFADLEPLLLRSPLVTTICMMPPIKNGYDGFSFSHVELIIIRGSPKKIDPFIMCKFESLYYFTHPVTTLENRVPMEFIGCRFGSVTISSNANSGISSAQKTVAIFVEWKDWEARLKFLDPHQQSDGPDDLYESRIASSLREMEADGVMVDHWFFDKTNPYPGDVDVKKKIMRNCEVQ